jgi:outer membrane cobalamin receptor
LTQTVFLRIVASHGGNVTSGTSESSDWYGEYGGHFHLTHTRRYQALWKIACNFAMKQVSGTFSWTYFARNRGNKHAFIQLTQSREHNGFLDVKQDKNLHDLDERVHSDDLAIWKYTYEFMACRETRHVFVFLKFSLHFSFEFLFF